MMVRGSVSLNGRVSGYGMLEFSSKDRNVTVVMEGRSMGSKKMIECSGIGT